MASNKSQNKIIVGVLSSSVPSVVQPFLEKFKQASQDEWTFDPIFIQLSAEDLDDRDYKVNDKVKAVVLLHSILEGRLSVTDVPDAKYNNLLPRLKDLFGFEGVGVIAHSMPAFSDVTKPVQMEVFQHMQPATFESSGCVSICGKLAEMSEDDWTLLTRFLSLVPCQRKHTKANKPKLVIITPEGDLNIIAGYIGNVNIFLPPGIRHSTALEEVSQTEAPANYYAVRSAQKVKDDQLLKVSKTVPHNKYAALSVKLGCSFTYSDSLLATHGKDYQKALLEVLKDWNQRTTLNHRDKLIKALKEAELAGIISEIFPDYVQYH